MKKIGRIILAWWYWITNHNDAISRERLQICAQCELRVWFVCGECSCPLQAKSRILDEHCPKYKWPGDFKVFKVNP
jgi:hypothetical protein